LDHSVLQDQDCQKVPLGLVRPQVPVDQWPLFDRVLLLDQGLLMYQESLEFPEALSYLVALMDPPTPWPPYHLIDLALHCPPLILKGLKVLVPLKVH